MPITTRSFVIEIGTPRTLEIAQGEDRRFQFTFMEPSTSSAKDMSGLQAAVMTVKDDAGILVFARTYNSLVSTPASGVLAFDITQADTVSEASQTYDADVTWTDSGGYKEQILVKSRFMILKGIGQPTDPLTSPPAIPVVYGLNWRDSWSTPSGGYLVNDAVQAQDGSLGFTGISTARSITAGVTFYPFTASGTIATGWAYVAQHGGGMTGATGPAGPAGGGTTTDIFIDCPADTAPTSSTTNNQRGILFIGGAVTVPNGKTKFRLHAAIQGNGNGAYLMGGGIAPLDSGFSTPSLGADGYYTANPLETYSAVLVAMNFYDYAGNSGSAISAGDFQATVTFEWA